MSASKGPESGRHRSLQDQNRRLSHMEGSLTTLQRSFLRHAEEDAKMHKEIMDTLAKYQDAIRIFAFANMGLRIIRWLAVVGAAGVAIWSFILGVRK